MASIAIVGGGIAGLTAGFYLSEKDITIFSDKLGGEYLKGGFKYLHHTHYVEVLVNGLGITYDIEKVDGAILHNRKTFHHPDIFWTNTRLAHDLQMKHWSKTRGDKKFDNRCMDDPTNQNYPRGKIECHTGKVISELIDINESKNRIKLGAIDREDLMNIVEEYDKVIYTIPIDFLIGKKLKYEILHSYKFKYDGYYPFEYLYTPDFDVPFHRLGFDHAYHTVDVEVDGRNFMSELNNTFPFWAKDELGITVTELLDQTQLKGHIAEDCNFEKSIPENVFLLGRYAEFNKRVLFHNVVDRIVENKGLFK